ncbi:hypothetical protein Ddc_03357 [Ditylenchus destructor]|nr:hypothetical protein Ddc_03357 [Ditylenchus destructor]
MTVDERSSAVSGSPFVNKIHGYGPSYSPRSSTLASGRLKRRMNRDNMNSEEFIEPQPKRKVYEEKMSHKLWNFHIDDAMQNYANNNAESRPVIEELDDDWLQDDGGFDNADGEPLVEEPRANSSDHEYSNSAGELILSNKLKYYLESCKNHSDHLLFRPAKTGKEVTVYRQPSTVPAPDENGDMSSRIQEIHNWDEEELDEDQEQIVSFPASQDASPLSSPISAYRKTSISPPLWDRSKSQANDPTTPFVRTFTAMEDETGEMEID